MGIGRFAAGIGVGIVIGAALPLAAVQLGGTPLSGGMHSLQPGVMAFVFCVGQSGAVVAGTPLDASPVYMDAGAGGQGTGIQLTCNP